MEPLGSSSNANSYSQSEPFFDLLQPNSKPGYHAAQNSPPVYFSNDDVLANMDFQPIVDTVGKGKVDDNTRAWQQSQPANSRNHAPSYDLNVRSDKDAVETATVAAVERTMKKYADNLLRVLEGMSGRLTQLESNSSRMEHSVDKIKVEAADNFGATDGKLRFLENMIREVQRSVQVIRDKQEIAEEQMKLEKLQLSAKRENPPPVVSVAAVETIEAPLALPPAVQPVEAPPAQPGSLLQHQSQALQLPAQQLPKPPLPQHAQPQQQLQGQLSAQGPQVQQVVGLPLQHQHQQLQMQGSPSHQQLHPQAQAQAAPAQHQQLQAQGQNQPLAQQQIHMQGMHAPPQQQLQLQAAPQASQVPPQSSQQLQLQAPPEPQYQSQQAPPVPPPHSAQMQPFYGQQQQQGSPGSGPTMSQHYGSQEVPNPYGPSQGSYNPELAPPQVPGGYELRFLPLPAPPPPQASPSMGPMQQLPAGQHHQQQHAQSGSQMFDSPRNAGGQPAMSGPYHPQAHPPQGRDALQPYNQYAPPQYRMAQPVSPAPAIQGGGYQQLPTARPVQSLMGSQGGPAPVAANRVPVDEVIDKVAGMGFGRDQVRAVVRRLTENGTSVDLNVVLDKLMNGESSGRNEVQQPAKGWYGR
jgi:hypothetical protein